MNPSYKRLDPIKRAAVLRLYRSIGKSQDLCTGVGFGLILVIGLADYLTGIELSFFLFYLLPISLVSWFVGARAGVVSAVFSIIVWFAADQLGGHSYSHPAIPYWNAAVRLVVFITVTMLLAKISSMLEHLRAVSHLKTEMLALVSHEFNNALTVIRSAQELARLEEKGEIPSHLVNFYMSLERVQKSLRLAIQNFLEHARMESGRLALEPRTTELQAIAQESLDLLAPLIERKRIAIRVNFPPNVVPVRADPNALSLVISNLLSNALKYTPPGGSVTVNIALSDSRPGEVLCSVEDTGVGIGGEDLARIFSGFYRAEEAKRQAVGYGLGLKLAREIIENHGSRLEVESIPGKGSRFFFYLPVYKKEDLSERASP